MIVDSIGRGHSLDRLAAASGATLPDDRPTESMP